jgi:hypothetical protein
MKKTVLLIALGVLGTTASFSQVRIGAQVHGSLNSGYFEVNEPVGLSQKAQAGFGAGIVSEISLTKRFSLRPSLNFAKKGIQLTAKGANTEGPGTVEVIMDANLNYIELPVLFTYNLALNTSKAFFGIGPSIGYGISGKTKMTYSLIVPNTPAATESEKVSSFKKEADGGAGFKRFDAGATVVAGMQFDNGAFVNLSGVYGLTNNVEADDASKFQNRSVQLTVGFLLK